MDCDLCERPVEPGQPRYGARGDGGRTGPQIGAERHYACHTEKYGRPDSRPASQLFTELRGAFSGPEVLMKERPSVRVPKVTGGEYNRSDNAGRSFTLFNFISETGCRRASCTCPFCYTSFTVYIWSLSGGGKKCPNCRAMFGSFGVAYPLVGNEDL